MCPVLLERYYACPRYHDRTRPHIRHQHVERQDVSQCVRFALTIRFGESEVITASIKILCFLGLIFVSLVITLGGAPNHDRIGFRYWNNPGAWTDFAGITGPTGHFLGFISAFINASFSFIGVETVRACASSSLLTSGRHRRCRDPQPTSVDPQSDQASDLPNLVFLRSWLNLDWYDRTI